MSLDATAYWVIGPGMAELRKETIPALGQNDVLVRTLFSGVSRGTESLVFHNKVPVNQYGPMRAPHQSGDFPAPVKYGYCNVGVVEQGPPALLGHNVFSLYPHQTRFVVPAESVHLVPENVPPSRAILAANLETAINCLWDATPAIGDNITIIGAGAVGSLVAWLAGRIPGCEVELIDSQPQRSAIASALGVNFALPANAQGNADLVIHASGNPAGLVHALQLAAFEATIVEMSWYGTAQVTLPLGETFHSKRLNIKSSQVGHVPASHRARWSYRRRLELALQLLNDPALDCLISCESSFADLPDTMERLSESFTESICHRIRYS